MFSGCLKLEYINIQNFNEISAVNYNDMFENILNNVTICINESNTREKIFPQIKNITNYTIDCSNDCQLEKCRICSPLSSRYNLCIECNFKGGYYPKENDSLNIGNYINCYKDLEEYYLDNNTLLYKKCYQSCKTCEIMGDDNNHNCFECKENFIYDYNYSKYKNCYDYITNMEIIVEYTQYLFNESTEHTNKELIIESTANFGDTTFTRSEQNEMTYKLINNKNKTQKLISTPSNAQIIYECLLDDDLNNNCIFLNIKNKTEIFNIIRENILSLYDPNYTKSQIIQGDGDIIFQITNGKNELELLNNDFLNNQNISILDLDQCENTLKEIYHLNEEYSLIYIKQEKINCKASEKNIQYEVYHPYNFTKLNLSFCEGYTINIYVKAELSEERKNIYEQMKSLGCDMLNINDPFYQDICTPYESSNNTDIILSDRINYIYNNEDSQCQSNCIFSSYLLNSLYLNCTCEVVEDNTKAEEIKFSSKKIYESFYDVLKYANFKILKCYKLIFNKKTFIKNIGSITIMIFFGIYLACLISYIIKGIEPLNNIIKKATLKKEENDKNNNNVIIFSRKDKVNKTFKNKINKKNHISIPPIKRSNSKNIIIKNKNSRNKKQNQVKEINLNKTINKRKSKKLSASSGSIINFSKTKEKLNIIKYLEGEDEIKEKEEKYLNVLELNELEYEDALLKDKRTCLEIYFDILYREHLIIFTFFICNDYNLFYIKFSRFIFLVATNMAMNVFFIWQ